MYTVFGLNVRSDIALDELPLAAGGREADVDIVEAAVPGTRKEPAGYSLAPAGTLLRIDRVGRFLIQGGHRITVEPEQHSSGGDVRAFLLGSAFAALLHQRGLMPLHASAILVNGRVVAFWGHSGAGKSTIAAWFHDRGYPILADDVCVIGFDEAGHALAYPGIPRLRLWREALEASGRDAGAYDRSFDDMDKYDVPTAIGSRIEPVPLAAIYLLRKADEPGDISIERQTGVEAVETLMSNTYRGGYLKTIGRTAEHLAACLRVVRAVPVFRAQRLWGFERFEEQAGQLHDHASAQPHSA